MGPSQPKTFILFPQLPLELRLKIWSFISPGPRTISIKYKPLSFHANSHHLSAVSARISPDPVPAILHICRESRLEALKSYELAFGSYSSRGRIYFDFSKDTLKFGNPREDAAVNIPDGGPIDYMLDIFLGGDFYGADDAEKVRYIVMDIDESVYGRSSFCWDEIRLFTELKELTILPWDEDELAVELMRRYLTTLRRVARAHPEWVLPRITVSSVTGKLWGTLEVANRE